MWLLVIEDEPRLADVLRRGLEAEGYTVDVAEDGEQGEELALVNSYDILIVDWRLPGQNGDKLISSLRDQGREMPILMLTVLDDIGHRVAGLDSGADDYLTKPFSFEELNARLRALLRRNPMGEQSSNLVFGPMKMDTRRRTVAVESEELMLRPKEYSLLEVLIRDPEVVHSRSILAERVWGSALFVSDNVMDVTVSGLRSKLDQVVSTPGNKRISIETVRGVGYRLKLYSEDMT